MLALVSTFKAHPVISLRADVTYRNSCARGLQFGQRSDSDHLAHQTPETLIMGKLSRECFSTFLSANAHLTYEIRPRQRGMYVTSTFCVEFGPGHVA